VVNAKIALEIDDVLDEINGRPSWKGMSCHKVAKRIPSRFRQFIFHELEIWMTHSDLVDRCPATGEEDIEYRDAYLYRNSGPLDLGTKIPPSPTIEIDGVRFGTDKVSHFFSEGWWYYKWYRKFLRSGLSVEEAEDRTIRRGIFWERTTLGMMASGVFSIGDLEANYRGLLYYLDLCDGEDPALQKTDDGWRQVRHLDLRDHVSPEWDESYAPPIYGKRRWKKIKPVLVEYCPMLDDPWVVRQREEYERRDTNTPTERVLDELIQAGKFSDPRQFALDVNCAEASHGTDGPDSILPVADSH